MSEDVLRRLETLLGNMKTRNAGRSFKVQQARMARDTLRKEEMLRDQALAEREDIKAELVAMERELARREDSVKDARFKAEEAERAADRAREDIEPTIDLELKVQEYRRMLDKSEAKGGI